MEAVVASKRTAPMYQTTRRHNQETITLILAAMVAQNLKWIEVVRGNARLQTLVTKYVCSRNGH